jgi:hypothetical protein
MRPEGASLNDPLETHQCGLLDLNKGGSISNFCVTTS